MKPGFIFLLAISLFLVSSGTPESLQKEIDRLERDTVLAHGLWGFTVMTADSGEIIASHNSGKSLIPASTMKILTTSAALGLLGENYRYETAIEYDGTFDSITGIITGNLYIRGSGDPTLESKYFQSKKDSMTEFQGLGNRLVALGVKKIDGKIIGDASCFLENPIPDGWSWSDIGQYYGAGTCGLAYHDNSVTLHYNSARGDSAILESVTPEPLYVRYRSFVMNGGKKDEAFVYGAPYGHSYNVYGSIPAGQPDYEVDAANPDPALQAAAELHKILRFAGIQLKDTWTTMRLLEIENAVPAGKRKRLTSIHSPLLSAIIKFTNTKSDNVYAEQLLRTLGKEKGNEGSTEGGILVVKSYWKSQGVNLSGLNMTDGSGLSRSNLVTTTIQATILRKITKMPWYPVFDNSLPVAGRSGSLTSLCKGTCAENNLHAKSGYINRARGYAGYVRTKSGKLLCFSLIANNYTCSPAEMKKRLEKLLVAMAELP
jgi:serine-type D-Ala-D-Ala carboxypeptidase/endopeptidase (penicillin-binding protein 4)